MSVVPQSLEPLEFLSVFAVVSLMDARAVRPHSWGGVSIDVWTDDEPKKRRAQGGGETHWLPGGPGLFTSILRLLHKSPGSQCSLPPYLSSDPSSPLKFLGSFVSLSRRDGQTHDA